jgi:hypothetical protein
MRRLHLSVFYAMSLAAGFAMLATAQANESEALTADAHRYVEKPCETPDQNPVRWAKTWIACQELDKKYCPLIGIDPSQGFTMPTKPKNSAPDDDSWRTPYENRLALGPLKEDPWTLSHARLSQHVSEEYSDVSFYDFVAVTPERFKSQWPIPQQLWGDYELRIASYFGPETDTLATSFFFRFANQKWSLISQHAWLLGGSSRRFSPDTCGYGEDCANWMRGLAPWPDLRDRNDE